MQMHTGCSRADHDFSCVRNMNCCFTHFTAINKMTTAKCQTNNGFVAHTYPTLGYIWGVGLLRGRGGWGLIRSCHRYVIILLHPLLPCQTICTSSLGGLSVYASIMSVSFSDFFSISRKRCFCFFFFGRSFTRSTQEAQENIAHEFLFWFKSENTVTLSQDAQPSLYCVKKESRILYPYAYIKYGSLNDSIITYKLRNLRLLSWPQPLNIMTVTFFSPSFSRLKHQNYSTRAIMYL